MFLDFLALKPSYFVFVGYFRGLKHDTIDISTRFDGFLPCRIVLR